MNDSFVSKHDPTAYRGKMDRLTFSKHLEYLHNVCLENMKDTTERPGHELINLQIAARNQAFEEVAEVIRKLAEETLATDEKSLDWNFNLTQAEFNMYTLSEE